MRVLESYPALTAAFRHSQTILQRIQAVELPSVLGAASSSDAGRVAGRYLSTPLGSATLLGQGWEASE